MKKLAILPFFAILAACGGERPARLIPVPTPCVQGDLPAEPPEVRSSLTGDSGIDIGIIAGSALELRGYGRALRGMLEACKAPTTLSTPSAQSGQPGG